MSELRTETVVTVLIVTFQRYEELKRTISALRHHIQPADNIRLQWVVSDDSSPDGRKMSNLRRIKDWQDIHFIQTPHRMGWGTHVNWAHNWIKDNLPDTEYLFFCEDDYVLTRDLYLQRGVHLLNARYNIGMLRYRGTAGTRLIYHQFEAEVTPYTMPTPMGDTHNLITYLQFDSGSPTLWLYSNGPHLKRFKDFSTFPAFHNFYNRYPEGLSMGKLEEAYAHRVKNQMKTNSADAPAIAILPDWIEMHFQHIGDSFQNTEHDIEANLP